MLFTFAIPGTALAQSVIPFLCKGKGILNWELGCFLYMYDLVKTLTEIMHELVTTLTETMLTFNISIHLIKMQTFH